MRKKLEDKLHRYEQLWAGKIEGSRDLLERTLAENEKKEQRSRIAILADELNTKHAQIIAINKEREELEEVSETALGLSMHTSDQTQEIERLNKKYKQAISDKSAFYEDFCQSVKVLVDRDTRYLLNKLEDTKLNSESTIMKRELE